jgi:hypothetical protein
MKSKILLSEHKKLVLKRPLPGCPKGRIFKKRNVPEGGFFHSRTDDEAIEGQLIAYSFTNDEINKNPQWFTASKD